MKKVFLSLATIAFVAVGSLTVTSCGGDDSTTTPPPPTELTENFVKYDGGQYKLDGAEYALDVVGENVAIYSAQEGNDKFAYYTTYFWSGDIENATSVSDLNAYGMVGYYVQLEDVELDAEGAVVNFTLPFPNEADLEIDSAGGAVGDFIEGATGAAIKVNTFTATQGAGTSNFDGSITFASPFTFDYNGAISYVGNDVSAAKGVSKFTKEIDNKFTKNNKNLKRTVSSVKVSNLVK